MAAGGRRRARPARGAAADAPAPRFDFRPSAPDVSTFPRAAGCARCATRSRAMTDAELGYGDPRGVERAPHRARRLPRPRARRRRRPGSASSSPAATRGPRPALPRARARAARRRIAFEDPCVPEHRAVARRAGLEPVPVEVDDERPPRRPAARDGRRRGRPHAGPPAPDRRRALRRAARGAARVAARAPMRSRSRTTTTPSSATTAPPVGALQGLAPQRVVYAGSPSKTLAPALRLGWLVAPPALVEALARGEARWPTAAARASSSTRSPTSSSAASTTATCGACACATAGGATRSSRRSASAPEADVQGIAAGLHATVRLPAGRRRGRDPRGGRSERHRMMRTLGMYCAGRARSRRRSCSATRRSAEAALEAGVEALAEARPPAIADTAAGARGSAAARRPGSRPTTAA